MLNFLMLPLAFAAEYTPQNGDIIFQTSTSSQSKIIQAVTQSPYSHVGIVIIRDGKTYVYEAIQTVQLTPLATWVDRGVNDQYTVLRLKEPLSTEHLQRMEAEGQKFKGLSYDLPFKWSDAQMYCSELVWKIYENGAGITLIEPRKMSSYSGLTAKAEQVMEKRWGNRYFYAELVVAPSDLAESDLLETVYTNY